MAFEGGFALDVDAQRLRAAMTVPPPPGRLWQINQTIRQLKQHGIWQKLDVLWMMAAHDAQAARLNWKSPGTFTCSEVNSPTFTANRGYAGNGTTSYLDTGWDVQNNGVNCLQNSAVAGGWIGSGGTDTGNNSVAFLGSIGSNGIFVTPRSAADQIRGRLNSASVAIGSTTITTRVGLSVIDRADASNVSAYRNGVSTGFAASTSVAGENYDLYLLCLSSAGTASSFVDNPLRLAFIGGSLSAAQHTALYNILNAYLQAVGAA